MTTEICYWKKICWTESKEGKAFMQRFNLDYERCRDRCQGQNKDCGKYITQQEVNEGGLTRLIR